VLKLGGSVVTEKGDPETVDEAALDRAAREIAAHDGDIALVHGGGSFGHHHAATHGVTPEQGTHEASAALDIHDAMCRLNGTVVDCLQEHDAPALPVHPLSGGNRAGDGSLEYPDGAVATLLEEGFLPVLHGDVVAHAGAGVTVLSGDELVVELAATLGADRVGVCSTVPGVLDGDGQVVERIGTAAEAATYLGGSEDTDVTGGMAGKVRTLLGLESEAAIFGPEALSAYLAGESVGTTVGAEE
jgi:isopentenyl phosphate kinase